MGEERKIPRLGAAAKEFNVGTSTIVEILKKNGIEIEDNRNVKLTADMYDILQKKLSGEKKVKEESQKIDMDFSHSKTGAKVEAETKAAETSDNIFAATYLLKAGVVCEELGDNAKALSFYKKIKDQYPQSIEGYDIDKYISRIESQN